MSDRGYNEAVKRWSYPDDDLPWFQESPGPRWECPEGLCHCHATESEDGFEFALLLCNERGARMAGARVRVKSAGRLLLDDHADSRGWLLLALEHEVERVLVEWAPPEMPDVPTYPFRLAYHLSLSTDQDEAARRRLSNLGFSEGDSLERRVRQFQKRHAYTRITGAVGDVVEELERYHDLSRFPIVPLDVPVLDDNPVKAFEQPTGDDDESPEPQVPDAPPPGEPPTAGRQQTGGGTPPGRGTAAPTVVSTLLVRMRARFSLRSDLADIRLADGGRHLPQLVGANVELRVPVFNLSLTGLNSSSTAHPDGILSSVDLSALRLFLFPSPSRPVVAELVLTPDANHELPRGVAGAQALANPVGPTDGVPAGIAKEHMLFRPLHIDVTLDPVTTRVLSATVSPKMRFALPSSGAEPVHEVANGGVVRRGNDTLVVDWRPDYVECRHNSAKGAEAHPTTGAPLGHSRFVHIHETNSNTIGSAIIRFSQAPTGPSAHYIVDRDGFVVKMANENVRTQHSGGGGAAGGAAWFDLRSQDHGPTQPATISAFNNISTGIEHVHSVRRANQARSPTTFAVAQMQASRHLVGVLAAHLSVSPHNVLADSQTAIQSHRLGRKIGCPGSGYDWPRLEAAGLATASSPFRPPVGHPHHQTYQVFDTHFGGGNATITGGSPVLVRSTLVAVLRLLGYHIPVNPAFDAVQIAVEAFQLRHFGGPSRSANLARVQTASRRARINRQTIDMIFGVIEERGAFLY